MSKLLLLILIATGLHAATVMRIACGSASGGTDLAGNAWQADAFFAGGTAYTTPALAALDMPYRSLRYSSGTFSYVLPLPAGQYNVTLFFIENRTAASVPPVAAGQRKFTVNVNGVAAVSALDVFATVGSMVPYTAKSAATAPITISVAASIGNGLLSGIQVDSVDLPPTTGATWPRSCEYTQGIGRPMPPLDGQMFSGITLQAGCWNITGSPRSLSSFRCRADGTTDVTVDLLVAGTSGLVSVMPNGAVACSKDGLPSLSSPPSGQLFAPVSPMAGAKYADGEVLYFIVNIKPPVQLPDGNWQMSPAWVIWLVEFGQ